MMRTLFWTLGLLLCLAAPALAHETRPGYLAIEQTDAEAYEVLWKVPAAGKNRRLGLYVRFSDSCVETSEHRGRFVGDAYHDRWSIRCPGGLTDQTIHIDGLRTTLTDVIVRIVRLDGSVVVQRIDPAEPSMVVPEAPTLLAIANTYFVLGVEHILFGIDHLLFVLALLLIVRSTRQLIGTITAFTVAHSLTLVAASLGWIAVPIAPVEAVIALSIVFVAAEILHGRRGRAGITARAPWLVAGLFGLLHGFGFASALHQIGLPTQAIPVALLLFNVGVEVGQILFVLAFLLLMHLAAKLLLSGTQGHRSLVPWIQVPAAYGIGAFASMWLIERIVAFGA